MSQFVSFDLLDAMLRSRVDEVVRRHWVHPRAAEPLDLGFQPRSCLPAGRIEKLARTVLDTLLIRQSAGECDHCKEPLGRGVIDLIDR